MVPVEEQEKDLKLPVTKWKEIMKTRQNETKQEMKKKMNQVSRVCCLKDKQLEQTISQIDVKSRYK